MIVVLIDILFIIAIYHLYTLLVEKGVCGLLIQYCSFVSLLPTSTPWFWNFSRVCRMTIPSFLTSSSHPRHHNFTHSWLSTWRFALQNGMT